RAAPPSRKLISGGRASGRRGSNTRRWAPQGLSGGGPSVRGRVLMLLACAYNGRCDHTSTNAPDPIRTPHLSVLGRERAAPPSRKLISGGSGIRKAGLQYEEMGPARPLGRRPLRPRTRAYVNCVRIQWQVRSFQHQCTGSHQNSAVKRAWARVVLGWVTSWEVL
ncbi:hypothetical protein PIB30_113283, partial [Stylosanthes scabra]|nr:hypothetical protein [Stylosanthes scabra]